MSTTDPYDRPLYVDITSTEEGSVDYASTTRGLLGDWGTSALRGAANVVESTGAGLEQLGISNPLEEGVKSARKNWDVLKPDIPEAFGLEGTVSSAIRNLPEQIVTSVGSTIGGATIGGMTGGLPGAIVGGGANMLLTFGLGTYKIKKEEYLQKNPGDEEGAANYALLHAGSEVGFEGVSDLTAALTFGGSKVITALGKQGVKATARNLLSFSGKELAKDIGITSGTELVSELATYGTQASADEAYGMGEGITGEGALSTAVSTLGMSLVFAGAGAKYQHGQRQQLKNALESGNEDQQTAAASLISKELTKSGDQDLAAMWDTYTSSRIDRGLPVNLDDQFVDLGNKINEEKTMPGDILSTNPDIQKNAVDNILREAGIEGDGTLVEGPKSLEELDRLDEERKVREMKGAAFAYNRDKNLPKRTLAEANEASRFGTRTEDINTFAETLPVNSNNEKAPDKLLRQPSPTLEEIEADVEEGRRILEEGEAKDFEKLSLAYRQAKNTTDREVARGMLEEFAQKIEANRIEKERADKAAETTVLNNRMESQLPKDDTNTILADDPDLVGMSEEEAAQFAEVSSRYVSDKNQRRTIASLLKSPDDQVKLKMFKKMQELTADTNNVDSTKMAANIEEELKAIEAADLAAKEAAVVKGIKGSKKVKEVQAKVKAIKKNQKEREIPVAPVAPVVPAAPPVTMSPTGEVVVAPLTRSTPVTPKAAVVAPAVPKVEPAEEYTLADTEGKDNTTVANIENEKGVEVATNQTPESILEQEEAKAATAKELAAKEEAIDKEESAIPQLDSIVERINNPVLTAIMKGDTEGLLKIFESNKLKYGTDPARKAAILMSLKDLGAKAASKYATKILKLTNTAEKATTLAKQKDIPGSKATDAIEWEQDTTGAKETSQKGTHKISKKPVSIVAHLESVKGKRTHKWDVLVDGKVVATVEGKQTARREAENHVASLTEEQKVAEIKRRRTRTGVALSKEEKAVVDAWEKSKLVNKEKAEKKEEKVADVVRIDPKTGERTVVPYKAPDKKVKDKLEKAEEKVRTKEEEEELDALIGTQEEEEDSTFNVDDDGKIVDEDIRVRKNNKPRYEELEGLDIPDSLSRLLDKNNWDAQKVLDLIQDKYGKGARPKGEETLNSLIERKKKTQERTAEENRIEQARLEKIFTSGRAALEYVIANGSRMEKAIAKLVLAHTPKWKLDLIKFKVDVKAESASYLDDTITLTTGEPRAALHEFIHAVTVQEMRVNPSMRARVTNLMSKVKDHTLKEEIFTKYQLNIIENNKTSKSFKANSKGAFLDDQYGLAYALINENEFLAQALSDPKVQEVLKKVELENPVGTVKTLWDKLVAIIGKALGLSSLHYNALSDVLTITSKLIEQDHRSTKSGEVIEDVNTYPIEQELAKLHKAVAPSENIKQKGLEYYEKFEEHMSDLFQSTYDNLAKISKELAEKLRVLDFRVGKRVTERAKQVTPFEDKFKKLSKKDKITLNFYLRNYNATPDFKVALEEFLTQKNMTKEFDQVISMLKDTHQEMEVFGLNKFDEVEFYFPRRVKDYRGLVRHLSKQDDWGVMDEALKRAEEEYKQSTKKEMTDNDRAAVLAKMISTGRRPTAYLKTPISSKERTIKIVNADMSKYYYDPLEALGMHIAETTERIEVNRMLGVTNRKKVIEQARAKWKEMKRLKRDKASDEAFNKVSKEYQDIIAKLPEMEAELEGSIGDITAKLVKNREITEDQQERAKNLIRARITEKGPNKIVSSMRNAFLLSSLTQMTTGVRQLGDNIWTIYRSGGLNALKAAINVASGTNVIKENFLDFQQPLKEFTHSTKFVDNMLKFSGLSFMDNLGKMISMEASLLQYKKMSLEDFQKKWDKVLTPERIEQAHKDIQKDNITDDVQYLVVSDIANYQPVFKSEQARYQLQGGNARILYFLKSYALKSASAVYRESIGEIRKGNTKQGLKNLAQLGTLFIILGASTDWLVDWLNGKDPVFTDSMIDTALTLGLMSQYSLKQGKKEGYVKSFVTQSIPPLGLIDLPTGDLINLLTGQEVSLKSLKLVPAIGSMTYNRMTGSGQKSVINTTKENIFDEVRGGSVPSSDIQDVNSKIRAYNRGKAKGEQIAAITPGTLQTIRKKAREKNAK